MKPSLALCLFAFAAASAAGTACTQRHRLGGSFADGAGGEAGAADTPPAGSGGATSTGGSGPAPSTGGTTGSGAAGGSAGASGASAGVSGAEPQPDPDVLL